MKLPLLPAALLALTASCADFGAYRLITDGFRFDFGGESAERQGTGALPASFERLEVDHRFGEVRIAPAGPGETPGWTWSVRVWADSPELARQLVDAIDVQVAESAGVIGLELIIPESIRRDLRGLESNLLVTADGAADLDVDNAHGDTRVNAMGGTIHLRTRHGDVSVEDLAGSYRGEHAHGELFGARIAEGRVQLEHGAVTMRESGTLDVRARHADGIFDRIDGDLVLVIEHGDAEVHSAGSVRAEGEHGDWRVMDAHGLILELRHGDVEARLLSGDAAVDVEHGKVSLERVPGSGHGASAVKCEYGDVELDLPAGRHARVDVRHGDVLVRHELGLGASVEASARHGRVRSDLPVVDALARGAEGAVLHAEYGDVRVIRVGHGDL